VRRLALAVTTSENKKIGVASATYAAQASCPDDCVFRKAGCYAERGPLWGYITKPLNDEAERRGRGPLAVARAEAKAIDEMATVVDRPMRLHTVGDCASDQTARIVSAACERYMDRGGGQVWTYTHAWRDVSRESWGRVSVLASCERTSDVAEAEARGYATALVVDSFRREARYDHDGVDILPCPAMTKKTTCSECRLCFDDAAIRERRYSIGFEIHGDAWTKVRARESLERRRNGS
jgi:hypothetical protein